MGCRIVRAAGAPEAGSVPWHDGLASVDQSKVVAAGERAEVEEVVIPEVVVVVEAVGEDDNDCDSARSPSCRLLDVGDEADSGYDWGKGGGVGCGLRS